MNHTIQSNPFKCIQETEKHNKEQNLIDTFEFKEFKYEKEESQKKKSRDKIIKNSFEPCFEQEPKPSPRKKSFEEKRFRNVFKESENESMEGILKNENYSQGLKMSAFLNSEVVSEGLKNSFLPILSKNQSQAQSFAPILSNDQAPEPKKDLNFNSVPSALKEKREVALRRETLEEASR